MSNKNYDPLDDVPLSIRQSMVVQPQPSPSYSVITDRMTPEGHPQSQVMSPNAHNTASPLLIQAAAATADQVQLRFQQMLQIQAPADFVRMLHAGQTVNSDAKPVKDVQNNVHRIATELETRTERLASCLSSLTSDMETLRLQSEQLYKTANDHHGFLKNADSKLSDLFNRLSQLENAVTQLSRSQVTFESSIQTRLDILEQESTNLQTIHSSTDALSDEVASMRATLSRLEAMQSDQEGRARIRYEELMKSITSGQERSSDLDTRLKLAMERIVGSERLCEKLRQADASLEAQFQQLRGHIGDQSQQQQQPHQQQQQRQASVSSDSSQSDAPQTPKVDKKPVEFQMTLQMDDVTWQVDTTAGWYDADGAERTETGPKIGITTAPPGLPTHLKKAVEVPQSSWKLLKDMPRLNASATEAWERGVSFKQWSTEMAAISEAIHPSFAMYFRRKLDEGRARYEKRLEQGFDEPPPAVRPEDRELETRLSLALLKILPNKMKTHALERGNTMDGISVAALLEAIYEHMTPGGIREKNSLLQYLRSPPSSNTGEELTATLRRYRLAQQRAKHLDIPQQAAHETIAALDIMVKPLERKHQPLSVRLGILRLQSNIQIPTPDGVELCLKVLEAEAIKLQAEDISKPKGNKLDNEEYSIPNANQAAAGGKGGTRLCAYFNTARGCLKGAECEFRHESTATGKGAKGSEKGGGKGNDQKGKALAEAKATAKAKSKAATAAAKAEAKAIAEAEAKAEAKKKAKADKKAAKAAAKAAAATAHTGSASASNATAASAAAEEIPSLAGAVSGPTSSTTYRVMMTREPEEEQGHDEDEDDQEEIPSLAGADSISMILSSSVDDLTDGGEFPTYAEATTPGWSDVEQGNVVSPVSSQDSEIQLIGPRQPLPTLWALDLSINEFLEWCRPGRIQEFALGQFEEVTNMNSVLYPLWWVIERDMLDDDERGVVPVTDEMCILKLSTAMVAFSDNIIRPVFVAWLLEEVSGRERMVAIIREPARPLVRPYPVPAEKAAPELSKAAPSKFGRPAKSPTVPPPQMGYMLQPDAQTAYVQVADHGTSSSSSSIVPLTEHLAAAKTKAKASAAVPKASAAVPKASTAVPKAFTAVPKASAAVPKASAAVPKASAGTATHGGRSAMPAVAKESTESFSRAMRCVCAEDDPEGYIPWLVGADHKEPTVCRLECDDFGEQPTGCAATSEYPSVLVDSGANEVIRPWTSGFSESGCKHTSVITASGDRIPALRTRDGELCIQSSNDAKDWLLSVRRLVGAGGSFQWSSEGAVVAYRSTDGHQRQVHCKIVNGLPFLEWEEFRPIRVALSQAYRGRPAQALVAKEDEENFKASETCTMEALNEIMWAEEAYRMSAAEKEEEVKAMWSSEAQAKELLGLDTLTYEAVWRVVQEARLRGQRTRRDRLLESQEQGSRVQMWVFGMYCHGGITGLTSLTRERPFLTRLLVRLIRQELPSLSFTTVTLAIDATLKPHRDLANAINSRAGIVGISDFRGGSCGLSIQMVPSRGAFRLTK